MKDPLDMTIAQLETLASIDPDRIAVPADPDDGEDRDVTVTGLLQSRYRSQIVQARKAAGLTQAQFADAMGFSIGAVRDWEQLRNPIPKYVVALARLARDNPDVLSAAFGRDVGANRAAA